MRISKAGVYVMIKAYGIEGMLYETKDTNIQVDMEKEEATVNGSIVLRTFDNLKIQIIA